MQIRLSYDTSVKHLYRKGLEAALPRSFQTQIPRTNIHRWRSESDGKYIGAAINTIASEQLELLQKFAEASTAQCIFRAYLRIVLTFRTIALAIPEVKTALRKAKTRIVRVAETARPIIGLKPILRLLNISSKTYHNWRDQVENPCGTSILHLCRRRQPNHQHHRNPPHQNPAGKSSLPALAHSVHRPPRPAPEASSAVASDLVQVRPRPRHFPKVDSQKAQAHFHPGFPTRSILACRCYHFQNCRRCSALHTSAS